MAGATEKLALADAIQLHDERVAKAIEDTQRLRAELDVAESRQRSVFEARRVFIKAISEHKP